jgi:hypothetical protein
VTTGMMSWGSLQTGTHNTGKAFSGDFCIYLAQKG